MKMGILVWVAFRGMIGMFPPPSLFVNTGEFVGEGEGDASDRQGAELLGAPRRGRGWRGPMDCMILDVRLSRIADQII